MEKTASRGPSRSVLLTKYYPIRVINSRSIRRGRHVADRAEEKGTIRVLVERGKPDGKRQL
jgi:hypothetical protein